MKPVATPSLCTTICLATLLGIPSASTAQMPTAPGSIFPVGLTFPHRVAPACPGEGCQYGTWLTCEAVSVFATEGDTTAIAFSTEPGDSVVVETGVVLVKVPGLVVVTQPVKRIWSDANASLHPGDTVWVLDYQGEGFSAAWDGHAIYTVEQFWPALWESDMEQKGRLVQSPQVEFWIRVRDRMDRTGWVLTDNAPLAVPNALDPSPLRCPT